MARIRSLRPDVWASAQVMNLSLGARLLFIGLITQADDAGRGNADARSIRAAIFPGDELPIAEVEAYLKEIAGQGLARLYNAEGGARLYCLPTWKRHQRIDKPQPARYPAPDGDEDGPKPDHSENDPGIVAEGSRLKGGDGIGNEKKGARASARPELTKELRAMATEIAPEADPGREWGAYLDHAASTGREIHDVEAGWRGWLRKVSTFGATGKRAKKFSAEPAPSAWPELLERARAVGVPHDGKESQASFSKRVREAERAAVHSPAAWLP